MITVKDVQDKIKQVNETAWKVMSKPVPKPEKTEEKPKENSKDNPA